MNLVPKVDIIRIDTNRNIQIRTTSVRIDYTLNDSNVVSIVIEIPYETVDDQDYILGMITSVIEEVVLTAAQANYKATELKGLIDSGRYIAPRPQPYISDHSLIYPLGKGLFNSATKYFPV